jgi:serine/threonine-protein kinase
VYGLGATLYDMLCGVPPFADVGFPKILRLIVEEEPRRLAEMRPDLPVGLVEIVERAMSKSPADRYQTMEELEDALLGFAEEPARSRAPEPLTVHEVRAALSAAAAPRSERAGPPAPSGSLEPSPRPRSKRKLAILGLLLSFGVLALLVAWLGGALDAKRSERVPRAREPQAEVQVLPLAANQVGPAAAPAGGEPKVVPSATASAGGGHDRPTPGRNAGRAEARATRVAISRPAPGPAEEPANCSPPFYYEGRKKLYKPGCI